VSNYTIVGRVGRDPELRFADSGTAICRFSVAVGRGKKVNGEWQDVTVWHDVTCFKEIAENAAESIRKGDEIIAEGYIEEPRTFQKRDGEAGVSLPFVANSLGLSLRWAAAQGIAPNKPKPAARPVQNEEPF
jgi:single-strand DNA-binding protein